MPALAYGLEAWAVIKKQERKKKLKNSKARFQSEYLNFQ